MKNDYILTIHDEIVSNLILMNCNNIIYNDDYPSKVATINGKRVDVSLIANTNRYNKFIDEMKRKHVKEKIVDSDDYILKNDYSLSASEIIIYLILLHHYILSGTDNAVITLRQINKEYRGIKSINDYIYDSYISAFKKLSEKMFHYKIKKKYVGNHKLVNYSDTHNLLNIVSCIQLKNDCRFTYNLGSIGKIIRDSKNYSTIIPKGVYSCKYININYLLIFLYIARMIYINRNQKSKRQPIRRISLRTISRNICKYDRKGYNMNVTYEDVFDKNIVEINKIKYNLDFYKLYADNASLESAKKFAYYNNLVNSSNRKIRKCINKNRDLKMFVKNLKSVLTILKDTHQIADFSLKAPSIIYNIGEDDGTCSWMDINGKNWDLFVIEILFFPYDTQCIEKSMQSLNNKLLGIENKGIKNTNIEREE